jgi:transcriptional regulator with XRE-family HTH domain
VTTGEAGGAVQRVPKTPNTVLRGIRENERHETRAEFAEEMARVARETGEEVYPDENYVQRLESGNITWPHRTYRGILECLCGRPARELGFTPPVFSARASGMVSPCVNVQLREAVWGSGMELAQFARKVGVDPKTAERWITRGVIPQPARRWKASQILGIDESQLWPEAAPVQGVPAGKRESSKPQREPQIERDQRGSEREHSPAIAELSAMLTDYGFGLDRFGSAQNEEIPSLADLERDVRVTFNAYQQSRFANAASRVSTLLADAQLAAQRCRETERARAQKVLALSYQAAASVLTKSGEPDLAWIAAERGFNASESSGSPAVRGSLIRSVAFALHSTGRFEPAMRLVDASADSLYEGIEGSDALLSAYGTLFLVGSMAAARFGDASRTADYLREASNAALRLGRDGNHLWTSFGPTNVAIHRVNTAAELGDFQAVLDSGLTLRTTAVPTERRVRYMLDIARVHALTGKRDDALGTLLTAERIAPEQVRQHYLSRRVVMSLIRSTPGKPTTQLSKLAVRVKAGRASS